MAHEPTAPHQEDRRASFQRLLFVADAAVAGVGELPPAVRAVIDAAVEVYVVTPSLPGRLAWLADDVDGFRHLADERLDTVLDHLRVIDVHADGAAGRGSVMATIADAVAAFRPDHILLALHSPRHANWQERRLIEHIEQRFGLPLSTYAVDLEGHTASAAGALLLCYDGSEDAKQAIERAGELFHGRHAQVVAVRQPSPLGSVSLLGATAGMVNVVEVDRAPVESGGHLANEGVRIAQAAGLDAEPVGAETTRQVWEVIIEFADRQDAATIVMGSRGLTGLRSMLLGSVSSAVVSHADRPTLVIGRPVAGAEQTSGA